MNTIWSILIASIQARNVHPIDTGSESMIVYSGMWMARVGWLGALYTCNLASFNEFGVQSSTKLSTILKSLSSGPSEQNKRKQKSSFVKASMLKGLLWLIFSSLHFEDDSYLE